MLGYTVTWFTSVNMVFMSAEISYLESTDKINFQNYIPFSQLAPIHDDKLGFSRKNLKPPCWGYQWKIPGGGGRLNLVGIQGVLSKF